jgi:hypothetical protein
MAMSRLYKLTLVMILIAGLLALANRGLGTETAVLASQPSEILFDGSFIETGFIQASDGEHGNRFGRAVAVDGDTMIIGANWTDIDDNGDQGAAYVFTRTGTTWSQQQKLVADDGEANHRFGSDVALDGDTILVSSNLAGAGSVYVFTRSGATWSQQQKLVADDGVSGDLFGWSLDLDGETAVIGAPGSGGFVGAAYLFSYSGTTWSQQQKIIASDAAPGVQSQFGSAVALDGDTAVIGADWANSSQGTVYVFTRSGATWSEQQKLTAADGAAFTRFGFAVAVSGDTLLVGAFLANIGQNNNQGAAYVFTRNGAIWSQQQKLTAADGAASNRFGYAVALDGHRALIGAPNHMAHGAVYYFARDDTSWSQQQKLIPSNGSSGESFGAAVDLDGDTAVIGAAWAFTSPAPEGGAYIFTWRPPFNPTDFIYLPYITR